MPLKTPTYIVPLDGWAGGLNRDASELTLEGTETPDCLNIVFDKRGAFQPRDGYARWDSGTTTTVQKLGVFRPESLTDVFIAVETDGDVYAGTTATLASASVPLGAPTNRRDYFVAMAQLGDYLFLSTLRDNTWRYNGTTWTEITDTALNGGGSAGSPEAPRALSLVAHKNRLFAGNTYHDSTTYRSRVNWSTLVTGAAQEGGNKWEATSFIDVNEDDGDEIWALWPHQSQLLVFKDSSLWAIAGGDEDSFSLYLVDERVGTTAPNSIASYKSDLFFYDPAEGVFYFDGVEAKLIDQALHYYIEDGVNAAHAYKAAGWVEGDRYYLSVPWGASTYNSRTFVVDMALGAWTEWDIGFADVTEFNEKLYMCGTDGATGVFKFLQGDATDAGTGIAWHLETIWLPPPESQGMTQRRMRRLDVFSEADNESFTVSLYVDGDDSTAVKTQTVDGSATRTPLEGHPELFDIFKLKFSGTTS